MPGMLQKLIVDWAINYHNKVLWELQIKAMHQSQTNSTIDRAVCINFVLLYLMLCNLLATQMEG